MAPACKRPVSSVQKSPYPLNKRFDCARDSDFACFAASLPVVPLASAKRAMPLRKSLAIVVLCLCSAAPGTAQEPLITPPVLENLSRAPNTVEVTITATRRQLTLVPGTSTDVFAYSGRIPGPTLEVREGDRVIVHFKNELGEETTVHWHGLHIPWAADGSPFHPIAPGQQVDFDFTIPRGTAGTYWYHPHPHHKTRDQVAKGL
jgi:FtsP/CotA-like multicopper oxidase with cupredoxin domain